MNMCIKHVNKTLQKDYKSRFLLEFEPTDLSK